MRICLVYDCLYPHTVGGGERWYRNLADQLVGEGHDVTYLTLRQWARGRDPGVPGVRVVAVGPRMALYGAKGTRRILPPLVFGAGVFWHLLRRERRYDVVHTASFPYFSLLAAAVLRRIGRYRLIVDWFEVWSDSYWREYLGRLGPVGGWVQRRCVRVRQRAFCLSRLHADRLRSLGLRGEVTVLRGMWAGSLDRPEPAPSRPVVLFAGRLIPEKQAPALVAAVVRAAEIRPGLRAAIYGDGPDRRAVLAEIEVHRATELVEAPGFVDGDELHDALRTALCLVLPSRREGYGLIVVEAASVGVPSVVAAGPDNAAVELIEEGVNGFVAPSASPPHLAAAILAVADAGPALRQSTADWFGTHSGELSLAPSVTRVLEVYGRSARADRRQRWPPPWRPS
jgi:glycosyltransferase involved in cell wall biosynthesis